MYLVSIFRVRLPAPLLFLSPPPPLRDLLQFTCTRPCMPVLRAPRAAESERQEPGNRHMVGCAHDWLVHNACCAGYLDETQPVAEVPRAEVRFINVYPSQRVAWSTASPHHNPHGEESEDCYFIEDDLSPSCTIPVKYITDT